MLIEIEEVDFATASYPVATLDGRPVPVAVLDGRPWFSTAHIQHTLHGRFDPIACAKFASAHVGAHQFPFDTDDDLSHVISTSAARALAEERMTRRANRKLRGWLLQQDKRLRSAPPETPGPLFADDATVVPHSVDHGASHSREQP